MIRITTHKDSGATRLVLEGNLAGAGVDELSKCWEQGRSAQNELSVDLTSVNFVDDHGKQLLAKMNDAGIKLFSSNLMSRCLIEELRTGLGCHQRALKSPRRMIEVLA